MGKPCPLINLCPNRSDMCVNEWFWRKCVIYNAVKGGAKPEWLTKQLKK